MSSESVWTMALNLPGFEVGHVEFDPADRKVRLTVLPCYPVAVCPHCGSVCDEVHQTRDLEGVQDLPLADRAVELRVRVSQFWCAPCARAFTPSLPPSLPELADGPHATERFLARAAELIRHGDVRRAAEFLRVPEKSLERWYYAWVERQHHVLPAQPIQKIGIDELSLKKASAVRRGDRGPHESPRAGGAGIAGENGGGEVPPRRAGERPVGARA